MKTKAKPPRKQALKEKKESQEKKQTVKPRTREGSNYPNRPKMTPMKLGTLKNASKYDE